jgi:hypothetical protein
MEGFETIGFIPFEEEMGNSESISAGRVGQFANDLAFNPNLKLHDDELYERMSEEFNVLSLVWELEFDKNMGKFFPSKPLVISRKDFYLTSEPKEVGLDYGFQFWRVFIREKNQLRKHFGFYETKPLVPINFLSFP